MSRKSKRKQKGKNGSLLGIGRPSALTPAVQDIIVKAVREGTPLSFVGPLAGVDRATVFRWMKLGGSSDALPYKPFRDAVKAAQSEYVKGKLAEIGEREQPWQAKAWLLERMFRDEFGGDKLEINQLKKELRELRQLLDRVPRAADETTSLDGQEAQGGSGQADQRPAG